MLIYPGEAILNRGYEAVRMEQRRPRSSSLGLASLLIVFALALMSGAGAAISSESGLGHPVAMKPAVENVTVSWQIRSAASVHVRLYRKQFLGREVLVDEVIAEPGVSSFEFVDDRRSPGSAIYVLRVLGSDGSETTLGSASCVEPKFAPGVAASGWTSSQQACTFETFKLPTPGWAPLVGSIASSGGGWVSGPEPPVPRSS